MAYQVGEALLKMKKELDEKGINSSSVLSDNSAALVERFNDAQRRERESEKREERKDKQNQNERSCSIKSILDAKQKIVIDEGWSASLSPHTLALVERYNYAVRLEQERKDRKDN
jgi:thiamine pyrophosphate-dependent acetolactate synthase large subunit-like protein